MSSKGIAGFNAGLVRSVGNGYTPTEWATGDVITAEKLNHMEDGISNNEILVLTGDEQTETYSHTVEECVAAILAGKLVIFIDDDNYTSVASYVDAEQNIVYFSNVSDAGTLGATVLIQSYDGNNIESIYNGVVAPFPYLTDVGKVLKVVSDGTGNAKLSWETS